jgi:hypothetical protein
MAVVINNGGAQKSPPQSTSLSTLDDYLRLHAKDFIRLLAIGHTAFYAGLKKHRYPPPDGYDGKRPYWHQKTAHDFLSSTETGVDCHGKG